MAAPGPVAISTGERNIAAAATKAQIKRNMPPKDRLSGMSLQ